MPAEPTPPALMASIALGGVGLVFILAGAALGVEALFVLGFAAGALSLGASLYWRSQLIRERQKRSPR